MKGSQGSRGEAPTAPSRLCTWCKKPFESRAEQELHVSLLGAPGEFHRACYEDYRKSEPAGS
ncbi:MAG: hypothetical protein QOG87_1663 [Actinomycetota bacterium]|jgi:hypothetical protein